MHRADVFRADVRRRHQGGDAGLTGARSLERGDESLERVEGLEFVAEALLGGATFHGESLFARQLEPRDVAAPAHTLFTG